MLMPIFMETTVRLSFMETTVRLSFMETTVRLSFKGVLIGGVVDVVSSFMFQMPFAIYVAFKVAQMQIPRSQYPTAVTAMLHGNAMLYSAQLLVGLACSVLGGYVAASIAKREELLNGALSAFLCVGLGLWEMASGKDSDPIWLQLMLLAASPTLAALGGGLKQMRRKRQVQPA
jgi:hypothetical protein